MRQHQQSGSILSRFLRGIGAFFRSLLRPASTDPLRDLDEVFAPIDMEEVIRRFKIAEEAKRFGANELPASTDTHLDGPQNRLKQYIEDEVTAAFRRANSELERLRHALNARDVEPLLAAAEQLPADVARMIETDTREASRRLNSATNERGTIEGELSTYKQRFGLTRNPRLRDYSDLRILLAGTVLLGIGQAAANAVFFSQGMTYGLAASLWFAVLLGVLDIIFHFIGGRQAARVQAPDPWNRLSGVVVVGLIAVTLPIYNLGLVHLRNSVRRLGFADGTDAWLQSMITHPFGFTDFGSFMLLGIGLLCSSLAVWTGWVWDEPVPKLREAGRKLVTLTEELEYWEERKHISAYEARANAEAALERLCGDVMHNTRMSQALVGRIERIHANLTTFVNDAERASVTLLQLYRDENRIARSTPPPAYFHEGVTLQIQQPLDIDLKEVRQIRDRQERLAKVMSDRRAAIHDRIMTAGQAAGTTAVGV